MYKFGGQRFDFNNLMPDFHLMQQNIKNRKAKVDLNFFYLLHQRYVSMQKEMQTIDKRIKGHDA